jgi:hypothetical protein
LQEYQLPIQKTLTQGLRPQNDVGRNLEFLSQCQFMKPLQAGLRPIEGCINPFEENYFQNWPFPQLIRTASDTLLAYADKIVNAASLTPYTTYDLADAGTPIGIQPNGVWHCADIGKGWILFNGSSVVFNLGVDRVFGEDNIVYCQDTMQVQTGCASRGRVLLGGISPEQLFSGAWQALWQKYANSLPYAINTDYEGEGTNFVYWSTIGGGDVLLPFTSEFASGIIKEDVVDEEDEDFFLELFKRNELGIMPMPWQGSVLCMKPLGKGVVVYGTDGIAVLIPAVEPYPTYGLQRVADFGIISRGAVGGDEFGHVLVDTAGNAWGLDTNFALRKLGYKEYISGILDNEIVIVKDAEYDEFYISGKDSAFILTPQGLGEAPQRITGAYNINGSFIGIFNTAVSTEAIIVTDIIDFKYRDLKTITTIEVGCDAASPVYVAIDYRYSKQASWQRSPWVLTNPEGFARVQIAALDVRIAVKCSSYKGFNLDYINVRWQATGRRTVRGLSADTANT